MFSRLTWGVMALALAAACGDDLPGPPITGLEVYPLALSPSFSPDIHDYTVRCAAGDNPVKLRVTDAYTTTTSALDLTEDQLVDVRDQAWIRCLPHDFPAITATPHPDQGAPTPGWYLVDNSPFAIVLDAHGTPVWYRRGTDVYDVDSPAPNTISFMPAARAGNIGFQLLDLSTGQTREVSAVGVPTDLHELEPLANGGYMVLAYLDRAHVDLTGLGTFGADETISDCEIQEVDPSGALVWTWRASDHVDPVRESLTQIIDGAGVTRVIDVYHCNAIDEGLSGDVLLSLRNASAIYDIDRATGAIRWKLGGTTYNTDGAPHLAVVTDPETTFSQQHDARFVDATHLTLFDDHGGGFAPGVARGVEYELDFANDEARPVWQFFGLEPSQFTGSFRRFADGHSVIGWGFPKVDPRVLSEVDAAGRDVLDITLAKHAYRALKVPLDRLDLDAMRATAGVTVTPGGGLLPPGGKGI